jgi:hypothetical protein
MPERRSRKLLLPARTLPLDELLTILKDIYLPRDTGAHRAMAAATRMPWHFVQLGPILGDRGGHGTMEPSNREEG